MELTPVPSDSWHKMAYLYEPNEKINQLSGERLMQVLIGNESDLYEKMQQAEELPPMIFDEHNCDLYDQVRPIKWTDPTIDVS